MWRFWMGWAAVAAATALMSFWAFWGALEMFHEGWFYRSIWMNLALTLVQYVSPAFILMIPALISLRWPKAALPVFGGMAVAVALFFRKGVGLTMIALPLFAFGVLYTLGRPAPLKWAYRVTWLVPLLVFLGYAAAPGYRALTRFDDGNYGARVVAGHGVRLTWAPEGPGWKQSHATWEEATRACRHLSADGRTASAEPVGIWRLPTVEEAVRSMVRHGRHAGGVWDPMARKASYAIQPEKESPLWQRYSPVIYWWTATEDGPDKAFRIAYNGSVYSFRKRGWGTYWSYRCVCENKAE